MRPLAPGATAADGRVWRIERVWPPRGDDPRSPLEARSGGDVRGGYLDERGAVALLSEGEDPRLPALRDVAPHGTVVSHRPGTRAVVRLHRDGGFAKIVRPGRAARVRNAHAQARGFDAGLRRAELVDHGFSPDEVVCAQRLPGRTLAALGEDPALDRADWERAWRAWRTAWLAALDAPTDQGRRVHDAEAEAAVLRTWAGHASETPCADIRTAETAEGVIARLRAAGAGPPRIAHRDLHDGQVLWHPSAGIALLDLDTCARADPALDLGNLAAHVDLAARQGRWSAARAALAQTTIAGTAAAVGVGPVRLAAWRLAAAFRVACVHIMRPPSWTVARGELTRIADDLERDL
ncbi:phosphotransferase [Leucobacter sp. wl10]|uniref:phosphotransferase n=1 Tax=Leucobacter sp. wl10 TaxID=2304677 RepID=UPI000E5ADE8A|nr:phosphotransferase [Leucobacter sp. wl10]RGE24266.1 hypothetical protein D1J51_00515 [Leucobacter sp. wl10]